VFTQGVMSSEKALNSPGLGHVERQKPSTGSQEGSQVKFSSLSLGIAMTSPSCTMLLYEPTADLFRISRLETPRAGSGPRNIRREPTLASSSAISFPCTQHVQGTKTASLHAG
jgi:hypothetical protein